MTEQSSEAGGTEVAIATADVDEPAPASETAAAKEGKGTGAEAQTAGRFRQADTNEADVGATQEQPEPDQAVEPSIGGQDQQGQPPQGADQEDGEGPDADDEDDAEAELAPEQHIEVPGVAYMTLDAHGGSVMMVSPSASPNPILSASCRRVRFVRNYSAI